MTALSSEDVLNTKGTQANLKKRKKATITEPVTTEDSTVNMKKSSSVFTRDKSSSLMSRNWAYDSYMSTNDLNEYAELIRNVEARFKADFPECYVM